MLTALGLWLIGLLAGGAAGCGSIYHRAGASFPPDPCARLNLRVEEARRAEKAAGQAEKRLRNRLVAGSNEEAVDADLDRVELAALELARRVAAAQDAAPQCNDSTAFDSRIVQLQQRSAELTDYVGGLRQNRKPGGTPPSP